MRILVVNVNTTTTMTETIRAQAQRYAAPDTQIVGLTPFFGPDSCEGNVDSYLAAVAVMDRVLAYRDPYDAVIQAGFGESRHGARRSAASRSSRPIPPSPPKTGTSRVLVRPQPRPAWAALPPRPPRGPVPQVAPGSPTFTHTEHTRSCYDIVLQYRVWQRR
ncbi:MAG: aspartate/glutamate racemase family protein [Sciscionella sp.]